MNFEDDENTKEVEDAEDAENVEVTEGEDGNKVFSIDVGDLPIEKVKAVLDEVIVKEKKPRKRKTPKVNSKYNRLFCKHLTHFL